VISCLFCFNIAGGVLFINDELKLKRKIHESRDYYKNLKSKLASKLYKYFYFIHCRNFMLWPDLLRLVLGMMVNFGKFIAKRGSENREL
jgi:hypothetical protein